MTLSNLRKRLETLEATRATLKAVFSKSVLVGVFDNDDDIIGAGICGIKVFREPGETISQLTARASRSLGMQVLFAIYSDGSEAC